MKYSMPILQVRADRKHEAENPGEDEIENKNVAEDGRNEYLRVSVAHEQGHGEKEDESGRDEAD